jgi:hypothetical protein
LLDSLQYHRRLPQVSPRLSDLILPCSIHPLSLPSALLVGLLAKKKLWIFQAIPKCFNSTFVCYLCSLVAIGKGRVRFSSNILLFSCTFYCFWRLTLRNSAEQSGLPGVGDGESEGEGVCYYYIASEIVILSAIFFTNGVIIMVIGKPIASVVKNMPNHISKKL